jgi:hypothetical protein
VQLCGSNEEALSTLIKDMNQEFMDLFTLKIADRDISNDTFQDTFTKNQTLKSSIHTMRRASFYHG